MVKIQKQLNAGKYTVLCLNQPIPFECGNKVTIDGKEYETEIVYVLPNGIGILATGNFVGKDIVF